jgi:hypothetical protein
MPRKVECIRTSSELEREVDGLVTHFAKHLSFVFCVTPRYVFGTGYDAWEYHER